MPTPKTYRKLSVVEVGPDFRKATRIIEAPTPELGAGEILIRTMFAGVNASDPVATSGGNGNPPTPFDIGIESTGEVVAVGSAVTNFKPGDHAAIFGFGGGYAEYRKAAAASAMPIPRATPEFTSLFVAGLTASMALEVGELKSGEKVLVTAAAGSVGAYCVQLAKQMGAFVIGSCGSDEKGAWLRQIGCDHVINYKKEDLDAVLARDYPKGVDVVAENVGTTTFDTALKHLAIFGRLVCIGAVSEYAGGLAWEEVRAVRIYRALLGKSSVVRGMFLPHYPHRFPEHLQRLSSLLAEGKIAPAIDATEFHGLESIADAVAHLHAGRNSGKVLIRF